MQEFDKLWNYWKPEETEKLFRALLLNENKLLDKNYHLQLLTQLARTQSLQRKFEEAHHLLDEVECHISEVFPIVSIRYLLERGRTYNSNKEQEKAIPLFEQALKIAEAIKEENYAVDAAHMLGIATKNEKSLEWNLYAMKLAEQAIDERATKWLAALYNNIGWTYFNLKQYDKAMEVFEKSFKLFQMQGSIQQQRIAKWSIAKMNRFLGNAALAKQQQHEIESEAINEPDGYIFEELGELYLLENNEAQYNYYFHEAYKLLSVDGWMQANESHRLERMHQLAIKKG